MKRKLFFGERMLYGDGKTPFNCVIPFKIRGQISEIFLVQALKKIQKKHPWLTAGIRLDEKKYPWMVTNLTDKFHIPVRIVDRVNDEQWQAESKKEWATAFEASSNPLLRIVWLKSDVVSEILLVVHHCLCDGTSAISILKELVLLLDNPDAEIGKEIPIQSLHDIIPAKVLSSYRSKIKSGFIGKVTTMALWLIPIKKIPFNRKEDFLLSWKLDAETTAAIVQFCKKQGFTVNTLLSTALLTAFKAVRGEKAFNKISLPVDVRNYNKAIKADHIFAFGLMIVLSAYPDKDFLSNVKAIQQDATQKLSKLNPYSLMLMMEACHPALKNFSNLLKYGKSSNDCMFSNLGRLDIPHQYQNFEIETIYSPSVMGPLGNTTTLVVSTYRNQMDFSFMASEGYLPHHETEAIREKVMEILLAQIKIPTPALEHA
ncbi:condensation domain-containing protein [Pedobacter sp.]|uniref:condensation domain-containing protein n=1 Tax=Pedobacter sp. TaxID=1411316 RepID=UPI003BA920C3